MVAGDIVAGVLLGQNFRQFQRIAGWYGIVDDIPAQEDEIGLLSPYGVHQFRLALAIAAAVEVCDKGKAHCAGQFVGVNLILTYD